MCKKTSSQLTRGLGARGRKVMNTRKKVVGTSLSNTTEEKKVSKTSKEHREREDRMK